MIERDFYTLMFVTAGVDDQIIRKSMALLQPATDPTAGNDTADAKQQAANVPVSEKSNSRWVNFALIVAAIVKGAPVLIQLK